MTRTTISTCSSPTGRSAGWLESGGPDGERKRGAIDQVMLPEQACHFFQFYISRHDFSALIITVSVFPIIIVLDIPGLDGWVYLDI